MTRLFYKRLAPYCVLAIVLSSFIPFQLKTKLGTTVMFPTDDIENHIPLRHRLGHCLSFGITSAVMILASRSQKYRLLSLLSLAALSLSIEYLQNVVDGLGVEWWDVRDDTVSAAVVYIILLSPGIRRLLVTDVDSRKLASNSPSASS